MTQDIKICVDIIRSMTDITPKAAIVLGTGLGAYGETIDVRCTVPYSVLPGFPLSTVHGHVGQFLIGYLKGLPVVCMQGRVHLYEGYTAQDAVKPIRVMQGLGAEYLILTNSAGGINNIYEPGDLVLISDHISMFIPNPLVGPNDAEEGVRFPDMTSCYDAELAEVMHKVAEKENITLRKGIYAQLQGPAYETPAEIRLLKAVGVDLVGMSTVVEVIAARHAGMRIAGLSLVSNMAAGFSGKPLSDDEVREAGKNALPTFTKLLDGFIDGIKEL